MSQELLEKPTEAQVKLANVQMIDQMTSNDPVLERKAAATGSNYLRIKLREDSVTDLVIPPETKTAADLTRQYGSDKPMTLVDVEPNSPACMSVPFGTQPTGFYMYGNKVQVNYDRIMTPRVSKDVIELLTYQMDIRQIISDNMVKDLAETKDGKFFGAVNAFLGTINATNALTGVVQYASISGGITRETLAEAKKIMTQTPYRLRPATAVINQTTAIEFEKWDRVEYGGDMAQEVAQKGWAEREFFGVRYIITIKNSLIPDNTIYWFASPDFLGFNFTLDDVTFSIERKAFMLEMFAYGSFGLTLGNVAAVARTDFV